MKALKAEVDSQGKELSSVAARLAMLIQRLERRMGNLDVQRFD